MGWPLLLVVLAALQRPGPLGARSQPAAPAPTARQAAPATVLTLVRQAQTSGSAGNWSEAARLWGRVVELNPVQPSWWYALGEARYRASEYQGAVAAFEKAAELGAPLMGEPPRWRRSGPSSGVPPAPAGRGHPAEGRRAGRTGPPVPCSGVGEAPWVTSLGWLEWSARA
jgi:tetratricopeptide (TPR) repeat protein